MRLARWSRVVSWTVIAVAGAAALGGIALHRGEPINAAWFVVAALCVHLIAYRFYSGWIATRVLALDRTRATPAERLENGRDFLPTNRWIVLGHHFAAIAGAGPLVGPTLAAQFGYLPATLWLLVGAVLGGCVQDLLVMFCSVRRDGRGLGEMARDELGPIGGAAALLGTLMICVILIAVLGLVVVKAMTHSPWSTFTVFATVPIALFVGIYLRAVRPGRVLEGTAIGLVLLLLAVLAGGWINDAPVVRESFNLDARTLACALIAYGGIAAILPVWLLLAPRDYLSTFVKLGVVFMLAIAVIVLAPEVKMPAITRFVDGTGPIFSGKLFPFLFITLACGAISGFHALVASGTTPKLLMRETDIRLVGYGSMSLECVVGVLALVAACVLDPGVYFAINTPVGLVAPDAQAAATTISSWGFPVTAEQMADLARGVGEESLFARTGGAPSLAVGMATIFASTFGQQFLAMWYHFVIMFEAVFILTTVDAGTRVCRFIMQDLLGTIWRPLGRTSWYPSVFLSSLLVVSAWGYFLYAGVLDPHGGINILWPLFGIANQLLAAIALVVVTTILVRSGRLRYAWISGVPLAWVVVVSTVAGLEKIFSPDPQIGFFAAAGHLSQQLAVGQLTLERATAAPQLIFNQRLDGWLTALFLGLVWIVVGTMLQRLWAYWADGRQGSPAESPYLPTNIA